MSLRKILGVVGVIVLVVAAVLVGQYYGRRGPRPVEWLSQDVGVFIVDQEIKCKNGKSLGRVQIDVNLTNGKLRVVRNDPGRWPYCGD